MPSKHYLLGFCMLIIFGLILVHPCPIDQLRPEDYPNLKEPPMKNLHWKKVDTEQQLNFEEEYLNQDYASQTQSIGP